MTETLQHKEAFEYYYSLGENRGYREVVQKFNISLTSIAKWGKAFNWQERILQRDIEIGKALVVKTNTTVLDEKANYRRIIKDAISSMGTVKAESAKDLEILVKLDLLLMGEATEKTDTDIKMDLSHLTTEEIRELIKNERNRTT
jgi:hypothetical protein